MAADGSIIIDTKLDSSEFATGSKALMRATQSLGKSIQQTSRNIRTSVAAYEQAMGQNVQASKEFETKLHELEGEAKRLRDALSGRDVATNEFKQLEKDIQKGEDAMNRLLARRQKMRAMGTDTESKPWKAMEYEIDQAGAHLDRLAEKREAMLNDGSAYIKATDAGDYQRVVEQLNQIEEKLREARTQKDELFNRSMEAPKEIAPKGDDEGLSRIEEAADRARQGLARLMGAAAKTGARLAKIAGHAALSYLRNLAKGAANAAVQLAKLSARAVSTGLSKTGSLIKKAGGAIGGLFHRTKESNDGFGKALKGVLRYGLGIRSLFTLFRRLRSAVSEGLGELAKRNPAVKASLNSLKTSLAALKGSLATAFAPILTAVAPALTTLINLLTSAINTIGAFMAALTGRKTFQAAVTGLNATGAAASGAAGAAKDLQRQLAGFDQLEILKANSGGGGGGGGSGFNYETQEIEGGLAAFADTLRELFAAHQFEAIGGLIADGINSAFEKAKKLISWDSLGGKVTEVVQGITGIFNGLVDGIDWPLIGQTFGEGVNTLVYTWNSIFDSTRFYNLGMGITEALNSMISTIDEEELGRAFSQKLNAVLSAALAFVKNFEWGEAGKKFGGTVYSLLNSVEWGVMGEDIKTLVEGVFEALEGFVSGYSWGQAAYNFAAGVNRIFNINWEYVGGVLAKSFNKILDVIGGVLDGITWNTNIVKFMVGVNKFLYGIEWETLGDTLGRMFGGLVDAVYLAAITFDWDLVLGGFATSLNSFVERLGPKIRDQDWDGVARKITAALVALRDKIDWTGISNLLAISANKLISFIGVFAADLAQNSDKYAKTLGDAIATVINGIEWPELAETMWNLFIGVANFKIRLATEILGAITKAIEDIPWTELGEKVRNWLENDVPWGEIIDTVFGLIRAALVGLGDFIAGLIPGLKDEWDKVRPNLANGGNGGSGKSGSNSESKLAPNVKEIKEAVTRNGHAAEREQVRQDKLAGYVESIERQQAEAWDRFGSGEEVAYYGTDGKWRNAQTGEDLTAKYDELIYGENALAKAMDELKTADWLSATERKRLAQAKELGEKNETFSIGAFWPWEQVQLSDALEKTIEHAVESGRPELIDAAVSIMKPMADWEPDNLIQKWLFTSEINEERLAEERAEAVEKQKQNKALEKNTKAVVENTDAYDETKDPFSSSYTGPRSSAPDWNFDGSVPATVEFSPEGIANSAFKNGGLLRYLQTIFDPGVDAQTRVELIKNGWTTLKNFVGTNSILTAIIALAKSGWSVLSKYIGTDNPLTALIKLAKSGWSVLGNFVGTNNPLSALIQLVKSGWKFLSAFIGTDNPLSALIGLVKSGWSTLGKYVGTNSALSAIIALARESGWKDGLLKWLTGNDKGKVGITLTLSSVASTLRSALSKIGINLATGGIITAGGLVKRFANGGAIMNSGRASWWGGVQKYAAGTRRAHGTLFVAGEAGPEVVGHIGGRTEVLNKSQLAQTMQSAVTVGMLTAMRSITFRVPNVATSAVPYEVAAQAAKSAADMQATLDANNEDLIQTIISVIGAQTTAIVAALQSMERNGASGNALTAQQVINEINRRTQMFSASPLKGV